MVVTAWFEPGQAEPLVLAEQADVDALLDTMIREASGQDIPVIAEINRQDADGWAVLHVGVRPAGGGFISHVSPAGSVISTSGSTSPELVSYDYMNNEREIPRHAEVPLEIVRQAARDFVRSNGDRPAGVTWADA
ncbi:Imm1 family immunity protein [Amycolatopsis sp. cg9]|uniref:Imm1 family immunity protein n=1 Tax=Amycolatopsis sp. cg9 TaxID=3238801 RepID=UPI00352494B5